MGSFARSDGSRSGPGWNFLVGFTLTAFKETRVTGCRWWAQVVAKTPGS